MGKLVILAIVASVGAAGCLSSSSGAPGTTAKDGSADDGGPPAQTTDGSVTVPDDGATPFDAGGDAAVVVGIDAGPKPTFVTGLGPGVVSHSAHFTLITKTGGEPGGSGVKTSAHYTAISGAAPAGK